MIEDLVKLSDLLNKRAPMFLIHCLNHQLALMMILKTKSSLSKNCSSTHEPLVYIA
jgi:uncharacterized protein YvpB